MVISGITELQSELIKNSIKCRIDYYEEKINQWDTIFYYSNDFCVSEDDIKLRSYWVDEIIRLKDYLKN